MAEDSDLILAATVPECGALLLLKRPVVATPVTKTARRHNDHSAAVGAPQAVSPPVATVTYMLPAVSAAARLFYNALESLPKFISQKGRSLLIR